MLRNLHHSNLLIGSPEAGETHLGTLARSLGIELRNSPDFLVFRMETFGIDEARELKLLSARKPLSGSKIFLIVSGRVTIEAQNALLKTFEDPTSDTYFFIVAREESSIIPTLRSRMEVLRLSGKTPSVSEGAEDFLSLPLKERLLFAANFAEKKKNLTKFLDDLMIILKEKNGDKTALEKVYSLRRLVRDSTVATRLVIEHLALVL